MESLFDLVVLHNPETGKALLDLRLSIQTLTLLKEKKEFSASQDTLYPEKER